MLRDYLTRPIRSIVNQELDRRLREGLDVGAGTTKLRSDRVHVNASTPKVQLEGTESGAENVSIRENAGAIEKYNEANAAVDDTWGFNPGIQEGDFATDALQVWPHLNLQQEGEQAGLAADATGIKYSGQFYIQMDTDITKTADALYVEAATSSSAGDEDVTVEVYDATAAAVIGSVVITGGSNRARSADFLASVTEGNAVYVRWNVTTASGTSGATFDAIGARLVADWGVA